MIESSEPFTAEDIEFINNPFSKSDLRYIDTLISRGYKEYIKNTNKKDRPKPVRLPNKAKYIIKANLIKFILNTGKRRNY